MGVVGCIATIAEQQNVLALRRVAYGARVILLLLFLDIFPEPLLEIEFGDLFLVFDVVGGNCGACTWKTIIVSCCTWLGWRLGGLQGVFLPSTPLKTRTVWKMLRQMGQELVFWAHERMHASWMMWSQPSRAATMLRWLAASSLSDLIVDVDELMAVVVAAAAVVVVLPSPAGTWGGSPSAARVTVEAKERGRGRESRHIMHCSGSDMMPIAMIQTRP